MANGREFYDIDSYRYSIELNENFIGVLGLLTLYHEEQVVAELKFRTSGTSPRQFEYHQYEVEEEVIEIIRGDVDISQRDAIIDMLRNESPISLYVFHDDTPDRVINTVRLRTGRARYQFPVEPVGEGEDYTEPLVEP